jgi:hypothetical protein
MPVKHEEVEGRKEKCDVGSEAGDGESESDASEPPRGSPARSRGPIKSQARGAPQTRVTGTAFNTPQPTFFPNFQQKMPKQNSPQPLHHRALREEHSDG